MYIGETISFAVALSWTATALFAEVASKRMGSLPLNVLRMSLSLAMLIITLWLTTGHPYPVMADGKAWLWLSMSGFVGYVFGDYCLFQSYVHMNSRFGQLFMTLASPVAALSAWVLLNEQMHLLAIAGMFITMAGICMSILTKASPTSAQGEKTSTRHGVSLALPLKGVLYGIGAGTGQGLGLVLSKVGMEYYQKSLAANGVADLTSYVCPDAFIHVPMNLVMPFASTMIRAIVGLTGFCIAMFLFTKNGREKFSAGIRDSLALKCAIGAAFFGPFIGVGLSLMATLYTNAGIAQTIMATTPILIILPSWLLFHQRITALQVIGAFISVCGVSLFFI